MYPAHYGVVRALCGSVAGAAQRWRQTIKDAEEQGDTKREVAARCAHMMLASSLLERGGLAPSDLAALIDTFQEREDAHPDRNMRRIGFHIPEAPSHPITTVEQLIDYAAARMSVS